MGAMGGACSRHGEKRGDHKALIGRPEKIVHLEGLGGNIILTFILLTWRIW
jgi:hypothetical protein